jgi:hypothetical protein
MDLPDQPALRVVLPGQPGYGCADPGLIKTVPGVPTSPVFDAHRGRGTVRASHEGPDGNLRAPGREPSEDAGYVAALLVIDHWFDVHPTTAGCYCGHRVDQGFWSVAVDTEDLGLIADSHRSPPSPFQTHGRPDLGTVVAGIGP